MKEARKSAQLTQTALGKLLGKPQSYISKIELGERRVESMELDIILSTLGLNSNDFIASIRTELGEF